MNSFYRAFNLLVTVLASAHAKSIKTRFLGAPPTSGTFKVPVMKSGTKGLRGTTPSGSYITVKSKGSDNPSPDVTTLVRSITPKSTGGEKKNKVHSSAIRTIPKGFFGGTSRQFSTGPTGGSTGGFGGGKPDGGTGANCGAQAQASLTFFADSYSSSENAMYLVDWATYDAETDSFTEEPIWYYNIGDLDDGREYNLEECLDETACYVFVFADSYGDGLTDGNGLSLSYDGATILSIDLYDTGTLDDYGGSYWVAEMGACGSSGNDDGSGSGSDQTGSGDDDDKDPGTENGDDGQGGSDNDDEDESTGSGNGGSCFDTVVTLTTDSNAEDMAVILYDENDVDANGETTAIFVSDYGSLEDNTNYVVEDMCLDNSGCYVFLLLDAGRDGFLSPGGLEMTVNGQTILSVGPGDLGTDDSDLDAMYWAVAFGNCDF